MIELRLILNKFVFLIWFALYYFFLIIKKKNNMGNKSSSFKFKIDATVIFTIIWLLNIYISFIILLCI